MCYGPGGITYLPEGTTIIGIEPGYCKLLHKDAYKMDFERIMLLLAVIKKAADCGMSHAPFVSVAQKELDAIGQPATPPIIPDEPPEVPTPTQDPILSQTMEPTNG
jgi:hypothetical protein